MEKVGEIILLLLFSSTKFFLAPPAALLAGFDLKYTILICGTGGTLGFFFFFYFAMFINRFSLRLFPKKKKKVFSRKNKMIAKVKSNFGLMGVALLTPCLLSIPLGSILAAIYYKENKATVPTFILSIWFWALTISCTLVLFKN